MVDYPRKIDVWSNDESWPSFCNFALDCLKHDTNRQFTYQYLLLHRFSLNEAISLYGLSLEFMGRPFLKINIVIPDAGSELNYSAFVLEWS